MRIGLIVPTYNAGEKWAQWLEALSIQSRYPDRILVVDSSSSDETVKQARAFGLDVLVIKKETFNHGGTRQMALDKLDDVDIVVFATQDAIFEDSSSIANIVGPFSNSIVGAVCGRQVPHVDANPIAAHARIFNYPSVSFEKSKTDIPVFGIKTVFISNSFSAYRVDALSEVGGFPCDVILGEDMFVASKMILNNWVVSYSGEARVYHSHNYTFVEEFRRYFDTGVFHRKSPWIGLEFGGAENEGIKYIKSELIFLSKNAILWIPRSWLLNFGKILGFKMGKAFNIFPNSIRKVLSMNPGYWS